jgi:hypothetical protein
VLDDLNCILVEHMDEVIETALRPAAQKKPASKKRVVRSKKQVARNKKLAARSKQHK